jgi:hypothetical protein
MPSESIVKTVGAKKSGKPKRAPNMSETVSHGISSQRIATQGDVRRPDRVEVGP